MSLAHPVSFTRSSTRHTLPALIVLIAITLGGLLALPRLALVPPSAPAAPADPALPLVFTQRASASDGRTIVEAGTIGAAFTMVRPRGN